LILQQIIDIIESVAPLRWQEEWDNSGLQVGERNAEIHAALLTTDVTEAVVSEAIALGCQLIVSHHPLLYKGLKTISGNTPQERCVMMAVRNGIAIYSSHTSMDNYLHGVSGRMAEKLGVKNYRILVDGPQCAYPGEYGLGVIGELETAVAYEAFLGQVKEAFGVEMLRYIPAPKAEVKKIAMCGGAGSEFMEEAIRQGADVFLCADCKYHEMQTAVDRIGLIDIDHWHCEHHTREVFEELLKGQVQTYVSRVDKTPIGVFSEELRVKN